DIELENIVGNLMIAQYQVDRLRSRLSDRIGSGLGSGTNKKGSTHTFKHGNRWYKITLKLDELTINERQDIE
ncbi:MAG: hypothetical protein WBE34_12535, partial [Candidatus Nitrosopolaris sp.]